MTTTTPPTVRDFRRVGPFLVSRPREAYGLFQAVLATPAGSFTGFGWGQHQAEQNARRLAQIGDAGR